jgi:acyl carrier protein
MDHTDKPDDRRADADAILVATNTVEAEACDVASINPTSPPPSHARPDLKTLYVAAGNSVEETLADMWRKIFSIDRVGVHDNFFELGGNSILALQLVSRVRDAYQMELPLHDFLEEPTISKMSEVIAENQLKLADADEIARILADVEMLTLEEVREKYADELHPPKKESAD